MGADELVALKVTTDGGATWTDLMTWDVNNSPSNSGDNISIDLSSYNQGAVQFAIVASDGSAAELAYNFYVDNFAISSSTNRPATIADAELDVEIGIIQNGDTFKVFTKDDSNLSSIVIYDLSGRVIFTAENINRSEFDANIRISSGNMMIFRISVTEHQSIITKKVIKQ
jgi:hypothetical protein